MKIKKCAEMARKLRFFKEQMLKAGILSSVKSTTRADNNTDDLEVSQDFCFYRNENCNLVGYTRILSSFSFFPFWLYQVKLGDLEAELVEINANGDKLQRAHSELVEYKLVLQKVHTYLMPWSISSLKPHFYMLHLVVKLWQIVEVYIENITNNLSY